MKITNGKKVVIVDLLRAYLLTLNEPQTKTEIIDGVRETHPEIDGNLIVQGVDYLRKRRGELTGDGRKRDPRYMLTSKVVKTPEPTRERGEKVRPFVVGIRDPLTVRDYDLRAGMNLAMLIRR